MGKLHNCIDRSLKFIKRNTKALCRDIIVASIAIMLLSIFSYKLMGIDSIMHPVFLFVANVVLAIKYQNNIFPTKQNRSFVANTAFLIMVIFILIVSYAFIVSSNIGFIFVFQTALSGLVSAIFITLFVPVYWKILVQREANTTRSTGGKIRRGSFLFPVIFLGTFIFNVFGGLLVLGPENNNFFRLTAFTVLAVILGVYFPILLAQGYLDSREVG
ncbi:MAG: hypothetical protein AB7D51_12495 [Desulfovibrionaceae bacterium]